MQINEYVVMDVPKSARGRKGRTKFAWTRKAILRAVWSIRCRVLSETGRDIFNVFLVDDRIGIRIKGDMDAREVPNPKNKPSRISPGGQTLKI